MPQVPQPDVVTVLYVEDDRSNQVLMHRIFGGVAGVRLLVTGLGADAIEIAVKERPALVLLDRHLPDMTGDQILDRFQITAETREIPVILISGDSSDLLAADAPRGVVAHLTKPYDIRQLLAHVDEVLGTTR